MQKQELGTCPTSSNFEQFLSLFKKCDYLLNFISWNISVNFSGFPESWWESEQQASKEETSLPLLPLLYGPPGHDLCCRFLYAVFVVVCFFSLFQSLSLVFYLLKYFSLKAFKIQFPCGCFVCHFQYLVGLIAEIIRPFPALLCQSLEWRCKYLLIALEG